MRGSWRPLTPPSRRIETDPEKLEKGLAHLVLTIIELLRQLMERQALHRIEAGTLTETRSSGSDGHSWRWQTGSRS
jgi:hypothetical protein